MRLRELLFGTALMSIALVTTKAAAPTILGDSYRPDFADYARTVGEAGTGTSVPSAPPAPPAPAPIAPSPLIAQDKVLGSAYYDTLSILRSNNPCSDFFGGEASVEVFNELVSKIRKDVLSVGIAMRMSGSTTNIHNARTRKNYRVFERVSINSQGPFYRRKTALWEVTVPRVGSFEPNTKEARVLMLLHELGHVVKGSDGRWLLPDDGKDEVLSRANSQRIQDVCDGQIQSLGKVSTMKDLGKYKASEAQPGSTSKSTQPEPRQ